ncbi:dUTP diphosphatase [Priestia filamentosa]|nr:dUTP diphosphatase [Priestia filamentosa]
MNLERLFKIQKVLDEKILDKHPELKGQNNLEWKLLALQVELGECANEHRGFKKWSNDQEPRVKEKCPICKGKGFIDFFDAFESQYETESCNDCEETGFVKDKNSLLEEYVDCLHFILSIGLELSIAGNVVRNERFNKNRNVIQQFTSVFVSISDLLGNIWLDRPAGIVDQYHDMFTQFILLGEKLGFTWKQNMVRSQQDKVTFRENT